MMDFEKYLTEQLHNHLSAEPQDILKLCYQAAFGVEHLLKDGERAKAYLQAEYDAVTAADISLYEAVSADIVRVNLAAWKYHGLPAAWLFSMMASSAAEKQGGEPLFRELLQRAEKIVPFPVAWKEYVETYLQGDLSPVHHSEIYREKEQPAYRIIGSRFVSLFPILQKAAAVLREKEVCVIAIDGRAASGKTTLTGKLKQIMDADVIEMDNFFLPPELRTAERLSEAGGNIHYERFMAEVLPVLSQPASFSYRIFSCSQMDYDGERGIGTSPVRIVEGSYSQHPLFGDYADVRVFSYVEEEEQMARILKRNGEGMAEMFRTRWIPMEENYFAAFSIAEKADILMK